MKKRQRKKLIKRLIAEAAERVILSFETPPRVLRELDAWDEFMHGESK